MSEAQTIPAPAAPTPAGRTRPFYWSVRRELWEHGAIWMAPLSVAAVVMVGFIISLFHLPRAIHASVAKQAAAQVADTGNVETFAAAGRAAARAIGILAMPYYMMAGAVFVTAIVVGVFYAVGALHGERRDRTILFWKSLPVSDLTTVLAKATLPLVVMPVAVFAIIFVGQAVMLALASLVMLANGLSLDLLTSHLPFPFLWPALARGLVITTFWWTPVVGWLLLVSSWAKRVPILWAVGPWAGACILEWLVFSTHHVLNMILGRLAGGFAAGFTVGGHGKAPVQHLADLDPTPLLVNPHLWEGLGIFVLCLAACVRLRRYRDPI